MKHFHIANDAGRDATVRTDSVTAPPTAKLGLPGVETRALYDYLLEAHDGGVGFYPISAFVHIDIGRKRTWKAD